jgi:hypothetical protein
MREGDSPMEPGLNTPEGWTVRDISEYEFLARHNPPRSGCYLRQLKIDLRSWKVLQYWAKGGAMVGIGLAVFWIDPHLGTVRLSTLGLGFALVGAFWLINYSRFLLSAVRSVRFGILLRGEISILKPHPLLRELSVAKARLPDGRPIGVAVNSERAAELIKSLSE